MAFLRFEWNKCAKQAKPGNEADWLWTCLEKKCRDSNYFSVWIVEKL